MSDSQVRSIRLAVSQVSGYDPAELMAKLWIDSVVAAQPTMALPSETRSPQPTAA